TDETTQRSSNGPTRLDLLLRWKELEQTGERLADGGRVHRRKNQMTRFSCRDRGFERFAISHFSNQDDVGILAQDGFDRQVERGHVETNLPLLKDRFVIL